MPENLASEQMLPRAWPWLDNLTPLTAQDLAEAFGTLD